MNSNPPPQPPHNPTHETHNNQKTHDTPTTPQNHKIPNPLDLATILQSPSLTPEQETELTRQLALAYQLDEAAPLDPEIQRIIAKVQFSLTLKP